MIEDVTVAHVTRRKRKLRGEPTLDKQAEGLVWHHDYGRTFDQLGNRSTFKAINPAYLIKHKL